ncbi:MAG: hypothetical protein GVY08_10770 [Bacteroidetes bacterium]|nr:hypothetical protein [Bacteroidota bacterium]
MDSVQTRTMTGIPGEEYEWRAAVGRHDMNLNQTCSEQKPKKRSCAGGQPGQL